MHRSHRVWVVTDTSGENIPSDKQDEQSEHSGIAPACPSPWSLLCSLRRMTGCVIWSNACGKCNAPLSLTWELCRSPGDVAQGLADILAPRAVLCAPQQGLEGSQLSGSAWTVL